MTAVKQSARILVLAVLILAVSTIAGILMGSQTSMAYAAVGTVNGQSYDDFKDLVNEVESMEGQTIIIEMKGNWDVNEDSQFDRRLVIPKNSRAALNMHGWVFDRERVRNNNWTGDGELICIEAGASLTINGGTEKTEHREHVYKSTDRDGKAESALKSFYGGVLTGGASTNGAGGIRSGTRPARRQRPGN